MNQYGPKLQNTLSKPVDYFFLFNYGEYTGVLTQLSHYTFYVLCAKNA
jgi:hypothetical protein